MNAPRRGFTLIEMLVTITIIGILAAILIPTLGGAMRRANRIRCINNLKQIGAALIGFSGEHKGRLPWQLLPLHQKSLFGTADVQQPNVVFSSAPMKEGLGSAEILISHCDPERSGANKDTVVNWASYSPQSPIPTGAISYVIIAGSDTARPNTVMSCTRNLSTCDVSTARWLGGNEEKLDDRSMAKMFKNEGNLLLADGSAIQSNDADLKTNGKLVRKHIGESGGIFKGPSSTVVWGCDPGGNPPGVGCGLLATYYTGLWNGQSSQRIDNTLYFPFGIDDVMRRILGEDSIKPHDIPLPRDDSTFPPFSMKTAKWEGQIMADKTEEYTFHVSVDNQAWIYVDGKLLIHRDPHNSAEMRRYVRSKPVSLTEGKWVSIEVRLLETNLKSPTNKTFIRIEWKSPSTPRGKIPCENLRPG